MGGKDARIRYVGSGRVKPTRRDRFRWWRGDALCRLGLHKPEPYRGHDRDCLRCGLGPL